MKTKSILSALALFAATATPITLLPFAAHAQATAVKPEMVAAEVKKVDKDAGKVTLKHAEIKSLDMPAMTMVFKVKDDKLWEKLTEGAKVNVAIEKALMGYNVTQVEAVK
jgi:Cu(I)/Ag(I) efflux system periplasmic protein CusF